MTKNIFSLIILILLLLIIVITIFITYDIYAPILENEEILTILKTFIIMIFPVLFILFLNLSDTSFINNLKTHITKITSKQNNNDNNNDNNNATWKDIINIFSKYDKIEAYHLAKKNGLLDDSMVNKLDDFKEKISNIFHLSHYLDILYILKDALIQIQETKNIDLKDKIKVLDYNIIKTKKKKYEIGINMFARFSVLYLLYFFSITLGIFLLGYYFYINFYPIIYFMISIFFLGISILFTYLLYFFIAKFIFIKLTINYKNDSWIVLFGKIIIYIIFFIIFISILLLSFYFFQKSGKAYHNFFGLLKNLIFPVTDWDFLTKLKTFFNLKLETLAQKKEFITTFIFIKAIFIFFIAFLSYTFIKHYTEKYIEFYDNYRNKRNHLIPPEFIKILSILTLIIMTIILIYGDLFINYSNLLSNINNNLEYHIINNSSSSHSIQDYIPLSIFLAVFGTIAMIATKDLLENYFAGISLQVDNPYEEGERIVVDKEMMEVRKIGLRADKFYGINSNTEIIIPHKKLINSTIINYTRPTLDYRRKITVLVPDKKLKNRSIPREVEKVLLLATFISTGVKKPKFKEKYLKPSTNITISYTKENIEKNLQEQECEKKYEEIENKWENFINTDEKFKKALFLNRIEEIIEQTNNQNTQKEIKKIVINIITAVKNFEDKKEEYLKPHLDEYCMERKYKIFSNKSYESLNKIAQLLVNINYYYFYLAYQIWHLKNEVQTDMHKIQIDKVALDLLDAPRVTSVHKKDDKELYWEVSILATLNLGEQSDEIIHHINTHIDNLWEIFKLPPYKIDNSLLL